MNTWTDFHDHCLITLPSCKENPIVDELFGYIIDKDEVELVSNLEIDREQEIKRVFVTK